MRRGPYAIVDSFPLGFAALLFLQLCGTWAQRMVHPYDLEWMEGGMLTHAWRLQRGLSIYPLPGPDFVPYVYPPGYSSVLAVLGSVSGLGYELARALSLGSTLAAAVAVVVVVGRHGPSWVAGLLAATCYLGCFLASGGFYDVARPDAFALGLLAWSIAIGLERRPLAPAASGLLLAAAFITKHNVAAFGFPIVIAIYRRDGMRRAAEFAVAAAGPALFLTGYLQWATEGRFLTYILEVPGSHPMVGNRAYPGVLGEVGRSLWVAVVVGCGWLVWRLSRGRPPVPFWVGAIGSAVLGYALAVRLPYPNGVPEPDAWVFGVSVVAFTAAVGSALLAPTTGKLGWRWIYGSGVAAVALVTACLMRAHHGGFMNVLMPLHWTLCLGFGIAIARLRAARPGWISYGFGALAMAGQLWLLTSWVVAEDVIPDAADVEAGDRVVARVRACEGPVFSPYAAWIPALAGHAPSVHLIALWDLNHKRGPYHAQHNAAFREAARDLHWGCVVDGGTRAIGYDIEKHYKTVEELHVPGKALIPKRGWRVRPTRILRP